MTLPTQHPTLITHVVCSLQSSFLYCLHSNIHLMYSLRATISVYSLYLKSPGLHSTVSTVYGLRSTVYGLQSAAYTVCTAYNLYGLHTVYGITPSLSLSQCQRERGDFFIFILSSSQQQHAALLHIT
jgi:hypothetical protein